MILCAPPFPKMDPLQVTKSVRMQLLGRLAKSLGTTTLDQSLQYSSRPLPPFSVFVFKISFFVAFCQLSVYLTE